ncbi:MAG: hypothetical protein RLZZ385_969 [Pseudomonadota bacterium]
MKQSFLVVLLLGALLPAPGFADSAATMSIEDAWLAFANARGRPSLIRGDVDHPSANAVFRVIPVVDSGALDEDKLKLGSDLFNDPSLSRDGTLACASCHMPLIGGADRQPVSFGIGGARGNLNAPTIFNAALNFRQFWDGRALTLQEQVLGPIQNPLELGHDLDALVAALQTNPDYVSAFDRFYPDGITVANLGDAIAYYETMNYTGVGSPFLRQFEEDENPLSPQARLGQQRFVEVGCASCHNGVNLGGNSFQPLGVAEAWYGMNRPAGEADDGLIKRSGRAQDRHVFKVPTLHNVANTGPWFHDGSVTSLQQAVDRMARHQSGRLLDNSDIDAIVAFLRSLGDSLGMLGDCAASGNYGVTMTCEVGLRTSDGEKKNRPAPVALPASAALARQHQEHYTAALETVAAAPARIADEMQRIRTGQVAHYDFLQYEHIEMLRHARALSYPPTNLEAAQREALLTQAAQWQQSAVDYELIIADFLRGHAIASGAKANLQDLLHILARDADDRTLPLLTRAEQSALVFYAQPDPQSQLALENAAQALQGLALNAQFLAELQTQVRLLLENVPNLAV